MSALSFDAIVDVGDGHGKTMTVNVMSSVDNIDLGIVSDRPEDNLVVKLKSETHEKLQGCFMVNYGDAVGSYIYKEAILYPILNEYYGIVDITKKSKVGLNLKFGSIQGDLSDNKHRVLPPIDPTDFEIHNFEQLKSSFCLAPPSVEPTQVINNSPEQIIEPLPYLKSRYYNILYSTSIPLTYFPKTALSRLKVLCNNDQNSVKEILQSLVLNNDSFNQRHEGRFGVLSVNIPDKDTSTYQIDSIEKNCQSEYLLKHNNLKNESLVNDLVLELKVRESQLQLLLLLEILTLSNIIESEFLNTASPEKPKPKKSRPSLIRKKNSKRKIIPTFLGMGVSNETPPQAPIHSSSSIFHSLNNLIEKMNLWDTLSSKKKDSTISFVAYVLVPHYKNKLPETINYIVGRIKSSNLKLKSSSRSLRPVPKLKPALKPSTKSQTVERPNLKTLDDKTFAPPTFMRSNSNLSSKNLHRRQVDFSQPKATKSKSLTDLSAPPKIFGVAKKSKSKASFSQVEATPIKKSQSMILNHEMVDSPVQIQITETPQKPLSSSPIDLFSRGNAYLSPVEERLKMANELLSPAPIDVTHINSSPIERKRKPGDPFQSPFFNSLNGSPLATSKKLEEINIFKRGGTKRKKQH
ncbi:hypothetical protein CLIB1444_01S13344 [[Candida] jaroonii]|uniref:Uncharacterized protein n=1 Tax=[Candida] jaroonii TaxID=467808 RepID=A0ACA9Y1L0_9ASCO|nr:hypothetical protein CLIB1444_01S13344 [[Candida] jaroonii]